MMIDPFVHKYVAQRKVRSCVRTIRKRLEPHRLILSNAGDVPTAECVLFIYVVSIGFCTRLSE